MMASRGGGGSGGRGGETCSRARFEREERGRGRCESV